MGRSCSPVPSRSQGASKGHFPHCWLGQEFSQPPTKPKLTQFTTARTTLSVYLVSNGRAAWAGAPLRQLCSSAASFLLLVNPPALVCGTHGSSCWKRSPGEDNDGMTAGLQMQCLGTWGGIFITHSAYISERSKGVTLGMKTQKWVIGTLSSSEIQALVGVWV